MPLGGKIFSPSCSQRDILHQRVDELAVPGLHLEYLQIDHHLIYPRCISCELLDRLPLTII